MPKFGVNALEGMACGKTILLYLDKSLAEKCYTTLPPIAATNGEHEIYEMLVKICHKEKLQHMGLKCRDWVQLNHNTQMVAKKLIQLYTTKTKTIPESDSL